MVEQKDSFKLIGLRLNGRTTNHGGQSSKDCGNLWQKFESENVSDLILEKLSDEMFAVYFDYDKNDTASFSYFIGCRVPDNVVPPVGLDVLVIPQLLYTKFIARGKMTACVTDAWKDVWNSGIKRDFAFDFEVYDARSQNWDKAEVDIYISTSL